MLFATNPHAARAPYPAELQSIMSIARAQESRAWLSAWSGLLPAPTPLYSLPGLAARLGVASVHLKDESVRSPLASFKALGAPIALVRLVLRLYPDLAPQDVIAGRQAQRLAGLTVISATDGNHGRALAAAAQSVGCPCVIVLHAHVSEEREQAIAAFGARIVRIAGNYDDSVEHAARLAAQEGWHVVSDTSYEGYEEIPRDVMQGYGTLVAEIAEQTGARAGEASAFTHVFLQGGVGGMAAGVASYLWELHGAQRPRFAVVEPRQADCLYQSVLQGRPARATGSVDSVMAGLACGETSPLAWRFLEHSIDAFLAVDDRDAVEAMRWLAQGVEGDRPIVAGESGAAGLAGLIALRHEAARAAQLGLDAGARVLLVSTEGATAPSVYEELVGESSAGVLARQRAWSAPVHAAQYTG